MKITPSDFELFLKNGALLRFKNRFYLAAGKGGDRGLSVFSQDFFSDTVDEYVGEKYFSLSAAELRDELAQYQRGASLTWREPEFADYKIAFEKIKEQIQSGVLQKAVPVLFAEAHGEFDKVSALRSLLHAPENLFIYGMWNETDGVLGATPETIASFSSRELKSMALAGTQIKDGSACKLLTDPKELHEHQLVVDDLRTVLGRFGDVSVSKPGILELPSLWHLQSQFTVRPNEPINVANLVKALHPTPALGVAPRAFDFHWMQQLPQANLRRKFGAPITFEFANGDFVSLVAIRNIEWQGTHILLGAGGGVVSSSQIEKEWLELEGKRNSVKKLMGM